MHKIGNPARGENCEKLDKLSIFVETVLFDLANDLPFHIRYMGHMLNIVDELNRSNLSSETILVGFDIVDMFPSIDNNFGLKTVSKLLESCVNKFLPTVIEALELCLTYDNYIFNNKNYLQTNGTAQGPHMSCSYPDLALATFDNRALAYNCSPTTDDVFVV